MSGCWQPYRSSLINTFLAFGIDNREREFVSRFHTRLKYPSSDTVFVGVVEMYQTTAEDVADDSISCNTLLPMLLYCHQTHQNRRVIVFLGKRIICHQR